MVKYKSGEIKDSLAMVSLEILAAIIKYGENK